MLDIEIVVAPTETGLDIVSLDEMKRHLRITNSIQDAEITDAIKEAAAALDGPNGMLNRSIFPRTLRRYLTSFPACGRLRLPYPELIELVSFNYYGADGASPPTPVDVASYRVRKINMIPEISLQPNYDWPSNIYDADRAIAVTWRAGYTDYPLDLKRALKVLSAHYLENKEATLNEQGKLAINRKVEYALDDFILRYRVPVAQDDWD